MGTLVVNNMFGPHVPAGGSCTGYRFILVQGTVNGVDRLDESPDCTASQRNQLVASAAASQSAFNAKLADVWPTWTGTLSSGDKVNLRACAMAY